MKITLKQWLEIERLTIAAHKALEELDQYLMTEALAFGKQANCTKEAGMLIALGSRTRDAMDGVSPYMVHPQQEWKGGDSSQVKNFTLREPHAVGLGAGRFLPEQVQEAVAAGLVRLGN